MLSIETCLKIINEKEKKYTAEHAECIRKFLYEMSRIDYEIFKKRKTTQTAVPRVSTEEQAETGYSLAHQEEVLRRECARLGIEVVEHFQDDGHSAKTFKRPAFNKLLE